MKKVYLIIFLSLLSIIGQQTLSYSDNKLPIIISDDSKRYVSAESIKVRTIEGKDHYQLKGIVGGRKAANEFKQAKIIARFLDSKGQLIVEEQDIVSFERPAYSRLTSISLPFSVYTFYNDKIAQCELFIKWE